ncbi:tol-pal system protein YbgF [Breoghania sp. L-A4]|nr:tol-pal system protein YbgF [Breoghania sp. L-A4]
MNVYLRALAGMLLAAMLATPAMAQGGFFGSSSRNEGEAVVRINRVEEQMRALTGQIEELSHQVRELQDQLRRAQEDTEFRFQELEGGGAPRSRSEVSPSQSPQGSQGNINTAGSAQLGAPPQSLGEIEQREAARTGGGDLPLPSGRPLDLSALATGSANAGGRPGEALPGVRGSDDPAATDGDAIGQLVLAPTTGIARDDYDRAYNQVLNGDYAQAIQSFQQFLNDYPDDPLASNAQYWMGESYYGSGQYREAADAFLKTYTDYPETGKAPDSLLKLGLSLGSLGQGDAACATYSELLAKYPDGAPAVLNRARAEQKSAGCS